MMLNLSRSQGLSRLRALRQETRQTADEMTTEASRFRSLAGARPAEAVSAWQLFQTPEPVASRMADLLGPVDGLRCLEPSAGIGNLAIHLTDASDLTLVEIAPQCAKHLYQRFTLATLLQRDFLTVTREEIGSVDRVLMNPPFHRGTDVKHIRHAYDMLRSGGLLVALCYNGTRQNKELRPAVDTWEVLPARSFKETGTDADVALITWSKP